MLKVYKDTDNSMVVCMSGTMGEVLSNLEILTIDVLKTVTNELGGDEVELHKLRKKLNKQVKEGLKNDDSND